MQVFGQEIDRKKGLLLLGVIVAGVAVVVWVRSRGASSGDYEVAGMPEGAPDVGAGISVPAPSQGIAQQYSDQLAGNQQQAAAWGGRELSAQQRATAAIWGAQQVWTSPDGDPVLMGMGQMVGPGAGAIQNGWQQIADGWQYVGKDLAKRGSFLTEDQALARGAQFNAGPYHKESSKPWYSQVGDVLGQVAKSVAQVYGPIPLGGGKSQITYDGHRVGTPGIVPLGGTRQAPQRQGPSADGNYTEGMAAAGRYRPINPRAGGSRRVV